MITNLRDITSLNNLGEKGQIATLLILMMVAALIFTLVTVNIGKTSLTATNLANAADAGALYLGSQLATKSNVLWESLGRTTQKCQKGGFASMIFGLVLAVVAIVAAFYTAGTSLTFFAWAGANATTVMVAGAVGGAIGGAAGGAYAGTGALRGAITGAMVGAAVGGGISAGASLGTTATAGSEAGGLVTGAEGATFATGEGVAVSSTGVASAESGLTATTILQTGVNIPQGALLMSGTAINTTIATVGGIAGAGLSAGSTIYNASVADKMSSAAFAAAAKALSGLPEYDRYREGVFLQVLSQTIDDPNEIQDIYDSDEDGDTQERVPYFQYWWDCRIDELTDVVPALTALTDNFINGSLTDFQESAEDSYTNELCRQETEGLDGEVIELARALESAGYDVSFWEPGTPPEADPDCEDCGPEDYYDEVGAVVSELKMFVEFADEFKQQTTDSLTSTWQSWVSWFYDPDSSSDYYDIFNTLVYGDDEFKGLYAWKAEIEEIRDSLPVGRVKYDEETGDGEYYIEPLPCQTSIDPDLDDEFAEALAVIDNLIDEVETLRTACSYYYGDMHAAYAQMGTNYGGLNPLTYAWTDSRGDHGITVETGPFKLARIETKKSGGFLKKKVCMVLVDYSDNGSRSWVKVTRKDPANKDLGILGKWNPISGSEFAVTRTAKAAYSYDHIKMSGK